MKKQVCTKNLVGQKCQNWMEDWTLVDPLEEVGRSLLLEFSSVAFFFFFFFFFYFSHAFSLGAEV